MSSDNLELKDRIEKTIAYLKEDLNTVRAGRANPSLLDKVTVEYYGTEALLKNISNVSAPDPHSLLIVPFDPKSISDIEKGISKANLGITPTNDGKTIRLVIPALTEERRKDLTKATGRMAEDAKIAVRNIRREFNDNLKKEEKEGNISEDMLKVELENIQKIIEEATKKIDEIVAKKDAEIMEV